MTNPNDIRTKIADKIISLLQRNRVITVHKTTRAGATTSLILSLLKQKKRFLVVEPTNKIIQETILNNIKKHCVETEPVIIHVPSNKECLINKERIECNENLVELPYLYLPKDCKSCYLQKECPVTRILHEEHIDGIALTYDKLAALVFTAQLFENSVANEILQKILTSVDHILLDEAHELMYEKISSLEITRKHGKEFVSELMRKLQQLSDFLGEKDQFRELKFLIMNYSRIMNSHEVKSTEAKLLAILNDKKSSNNSKHQAASIPNPFLNLAIRTALEKEKGPKGNKDYTPDGHFIGEIDDYKLVEGSKIIYEKIIELTDYIGEFGISINHVLALCDMLNIIKSEQLTIHCQKRLKITYLADKRIETWFDETEICAIDELRLEALRSFLCMHKGKILITSATLCSYDYSTLLRIKKPIKEVLFGPNGDPLNTNSKMVIFADTKSFSGFGEYSVYNQRDDIMQRCKDIMDIHGSENCLIICMNKEDWKMFKKLFAETDYHPQITYYKAPEVMGVESEKRVGILIGLAHKPGHAFDAMRPNARESQILKVESMHADVAQAGARPKDPAGINVSLLFGLGCREKGLYYAFSWGIGRSLTTQIREDSDRPKVTGVAITGENCSKPTIVSQKSWPETLISSVLCKNYLYSKPQKVPYISDINGTFSTYEYKINSRCSLVDRLFCDQNVSVLFKNEQIILTKDLIAKHCAGKLKLDFYTLQPDNTVNFVMFESKNEYAISRLKLFLDNLSIPYVIERIVPIVKIKQNADHFRVWILLNNTSADKARDFAESILKIAGFNIRGDKEIEYYPRQTKRNTHDIGERIPMPFGANSQVLVDGKFVKDFDEFTLGCVDLSSQPSDLEPNKWIYDEGDDSSVSFKI
jgi:polyhydroxyalkanoate synthesis regulator phasin